MKKLMTAMLGLSLFVGAASMFAADKPTDTSKSTSKSTAKKAKKASKKSKTTSAPPAAK
jgi:hypothetical protein